MIVFRHTFLLALLLGVTVVVFIPGKSLSMSMLEDIACTCWLWVTVVKSPLSFWSQERVAGSVGRTLGAKSHDLHR